MGPDGCGEGAADSECCEEDVADAIPPAEAS